MKSKILSLVSLLLVTVLLVASCSSDDIDFTALWEGATYSSDTTLGDGALSITVSVEAGEKKVILTVKTDSATLGAALYEEGVIDNASFFTVCNGMKADWDAHNAYWAFYIGEEYQMIGVNDATLTDGASYRLVYMTSE